MTNTPTEVYSADERTASNEFYLAAVRSRNHPFIEFTGLINEYIMLCEAAHAQGQDFTQANIHSGQALPMQAHNVAYLGEKLGCIYGPALTPALREQLIRSLGAR